MKSENAVIGAMIMEPDCIDLVQRYIRDPSYFADPRLGNIFRIIVEMKDNGEQVDLATVVDKLPSSATNFIELISNITDDLTTTAYVEDYAKVVAEGFARRKLKELARIDPLNRDKFKTPLDAITAFEQGLRDAESILQYSKDVTAEELVEEVISEIEEEAGGESNNLSPTGFIDLDRLILGWEKTENVILAARPAMGKTALALNFALHVANREPVIIFSLEMGKKRLMERLFAIKGKIDSEKIKTRRLDEADFYKLSNAAEAISKLNLYIYDDVFNMSEIRSISSRHAAKGRVGIIIVDYLQLIRDNKKFQNRNTELGYYAYEIARLAKSCDTTTLTLSQLSRNVEHRDDKRPRLSDLYESGAIEAAADKVLFLYRDEVYNPDTEEKGIAEIGCAKSRDGNIGKVKLAWNGQWFRFDNLARETNHDYA